MRTHALAISLAISIGVACAIHAPAPLPRFALGCYEVSAKGWTEETGELVGFSRLPHVIALDTVRAAWESLVLVSKDWAWISWNKINMGFWGCTAEDVLLLSGDTVITLPGSRAHVMALDSITVTWARLGSVTAFLGVTTDGYAGFGRIEPSEMARHLPPLWVELKRMRCADWKGSPLVDPLNGQVDP